MTPGSKKAVPREERVKTVTFLNDAQVEVLRRTYRLLLDYLGADGSKSGLKEWLAERELGGEFLMLCEMWDDIVSCPEIIIGKVGKIMGQMIDAGDNARRFGWDSKYGREWERLRMSKIHLHHILIYAGTIIQDEQVKVLLSTHQFEQ